MKARKVFAGKGRRVIKHLSIDERIVAIRVQLGQSRREAVQSLRWLELTIQARQLA